MADGDIIIESIALGGHRITIRPVKVLPSDIICATLVAGERTETKVWTFDQLLRASLEGEVVR